MPTALASYLSNLGGVFRSKGDVDGANDAYCRALDHLRKAMPPLNEIERVVAAEESEAFEREADAFDRDARDAPGTEKTGTTSVDDTESMLGPSGFLNTAASVLNNLGLLYKSLVNRKARAGAICVAHPAVIAVGEFDRRTPRGTATWARRCSTWATPSSRWTLRARGALRAPVGIAHDVDVARATSGSLRQSRKGSRHLPLRPERDAARFETPSARVAFRGGVVHERAPVRRAGADA